MLRKRRRRIAGSSSEASDDEVEGPNAAYKPPVTRGKEKVQKKARRQVMKIHGISVTPEGDWLFAVSFSKAKTHHYMTHAQMKEMYPMYLIGFYERHLKLQDMVQPPPEEKEEEDKKTVTPDLDLSHETDATKEDVESDILHTSNS